MSTVAQVLWWFWQGWYHQLRRWNNLLRHSTRFFTRLECCANYDKFLPRAWHAVCMVVYGSCCIQVLLFFTTYMWAPKHSFGAQKWYSEWNHSHPHQFRNPTTKSSLELQTLGLLFAKAVVFFTMLQMKTDSPTCFTQALQGFVSFSLSWHSINTKPQSSFAVWCSLGWRPMTWNLIPLLHLMTVVVCFIPLPFRTCFSSHTSCSALNRFCVTYSTLLSELYKCRPSHIRNTQPRANLGKGGGGGCMVLFRRYIFTQTVRLKEMDAL